MKAADAKWTKHLHSEFSTFVYGEHVGLSKCSIVLLLQMSIINYSSYLQTTLWSNFVAHNLTPTPSLFKCPSFKIQATKYSEKNNEYELATKWSWHLTINPTYLCLQIEPQRKCFNQGQAARDSWRRGFLLLSEVCYPC